MKNIAITGISGYIGTRLLSHLDGIDSVQKIIGIDIKQPAFNTPTVSHTLPTTMRLGTSIDSMP